VQSLRPTHKKGTVKLPILDRLKDGVKFDFSILAENAEQTDEFLTWWWAEKAKRGEISRPEVIDDADPILTETINKPSVDLACYPDFFDRTLSDAIKQGRLPSRDGCPRELFRDLLLRIVANSSARLEGRPQIVFAGGGYGSGKTTVLNMLAKSEKLPVGLPHLVGVDVFKPLVPEYNLIKAVADGRASGTVQKECYGMATDLFDLLTEHGRSFAWDSSMSNKVETMARIERAKEKGYELTMVAVFTPVQIALQRAMRRAEISRRFPNPKALPESHIGFRQNFNDYILCFEEITVFTNEGEEPNSCMVIAEKQAGANGLAIYDEEMFSHALFVPKAL
jgi:predicted ABC-type ATPase